MDEAHHLTNKQIEALKKELSFWTAYLEKVKINNHHDVDILEEGPLCQEYNSRSCTDKDGNVCPLKSSAAHTHECTPAYTQVVEYANYQPNDELLQIALEQLMHEMKTTLEKNHAYTHRSFDFAL